jgi:hypothetical protein
MISPVQIFCGIINLFTGPSLINSRGHEHVRPSYFFYYEPLCIVLHEKLFSAISDFEVRIG